MGALVRENAFIGLDDEVFAVVPSLVVDELIVLELGVQPQLVRQLIEVIRLLASAHLNDRHLLLKVLKMLLDVDDGISIVILLLLLPE